MASVVEKIKDKVENVLHKDKDPHTHTTGTHTTGAHHTGTHTTGTHGHSTNAGPHSSNVANKVDPTVDSDRDGSRNMGMASHGPGGHATGTHTTGTYGHSTNAGPHSSNVANKADPTVDSDRDGSRNLGMASHGPGGHHTTGAGLTGTGTGVTGGATHTAGPHNSDMLNKVDPRVDSDRDGSRNMGMASYGPGGHQTTGGGLTNTGTGVTGGATHTAGPHNSDMLNKVDPRVDSDRDGSRNMGVASHGPGGHHTGGGLAASARHNTSTNTGPHNSNLLNKADPTVDSDRDGSRNMGMASHGPGGHHTGGGLAASAGYNNSTNTGPHNSNLLNKADPTVDSDRDGSRNMGMASHGPGGHHTTGTGVGGGMTGHSAGPASNTAGPHSSNLANKLDPRVDSDLDGSRTVGGNATY